MFENHTYNLMLQAVEENKSLWRIRHMYRKDSDGCDVCTNFWNKLETDKESHVKELTALIKQHLG